MPFTISHIAAVLPGQRPLRRWGLMSAAMIGSMVPDFGLLSPWPLSRAQTHGMRALLTFCLPAGLLAWALFQTLIKPAWSAVFPEGWRLRLLAEHPDVRLTHGRVWLGAAAAILGGALTHLVWDGFTHEGGRGVRLLPLLDDSAPVIAGHVLPLYRWLQHGSSVLGLGVVIWAAWRWTRSATQAGAAVPSYSGALSTGLSRAERRAWLAAYAGLPLCLLAAVFIWRVQRVESVFSVTAETTRLAYLGLRSACVALLGISVLIRLRLDACRALQ
ncbi:MAG: DUF4184 family protein [Steroidobacteraceae bacterium]